MRLVVGPLPASVYWRRRAMVLGAVALAVIMIVYSCNGSSGNTASPEAANSASASGQPPSPAPSEQGVVAPVGEVSSPPSAPEVVDPQTCTDDELKVTAEPEQTTFAAGTAIIIKLVVKNASNRACSRDVGPNQQELYVVKGTERVWSSDHCSGPTGSDLRTMPPDHERSYQTSWNGKSSTSCTQSKNPDPDGPPPAPGEYQLFGRIGTDLSEPVTLTLTKSI